MADILAAKRSGDGPVPLEADTRRRRRCSVPKEQAAGALAMQRITVEFPDDEGTPWPDCWNRLHREHRSRVMPCSPTVFMCDKDIA